MEGQPEIMTTTEVCEYLGITRQTLYRRIEAKRIDPLPKNPAKDWEPLRFRRQDVEALKSPSSAVESLKQT